MTSRVAVASVLVSFALSIPLWAKGEMVLIEIKGGALAAPIKITDPKIEEFNVWAGPGVTNFDWATGKGFIIDWTSRAIAQPAAGLQHFELSFYKGCRTPANDPNCLAEKPSLVYVVSYDYDPSSKRGFVYLPGKGDARYYPNCGTICHGPGVEGQWFLASEAWERFVRPLIASALYRSHRIS
jgi:hypothetical protein